MTGNARNTRRYLEFVISVHYC